MPDRLEDEHTAEQMYVEDVGVVFEQAGFPRMAARVIGRLLICEPSHQSPGELASALQASKASISTSVRLLIQFGIVERVAFPGKRRDYYRIRDEAWSRMTEERMGLVTTIRALAERGIALRAETGHDGGLATARDAGVLRLLRARNARDHRALAGGVAGHAARIGRFTAKRCRRTAQCVVSVHGGGAKRL